MKMFVHCGKAARDTTAALRKAPLTKAQQHPTHNQNGASRDTIHIAPIVQTSHSLQQRRWRSTLPLHQHHTLTANGGSTALRPRAHHGHTAMAARSAHKLPSKRARVRRGVSEGVAGDITLAIPASARQFETHTLGLASRCRHAMLFWRVSVTPHLWLENT